MSGEWFSRSMLRSVGAFRIACCRLVTSFMNGIEWFSLCQASVRDTRKSSVLSSASSVCGIEIFLSCFWFVTFVGDNRFFHHTVCRIEYGRKQHHEHLNSQITNKYFHRLLAIKNWTDNNWLVINRSQSIDFCYFFVDVIFTFFFLLLSVAVVRFIQWRLLSCALRLEDKINVCAPKIGCRKKYSAIESIESTIFILLFCLFICFSLGKFREFFCLFFVVVVVLLKSWRKM